MTGLLFSSMAIGSLGATLVSAWSRHVRHQGRAVVIAATVWGFFIVAASSAPSPLMFVLCLVGAGAADMISGLFRGIIWNHAVPNAMRGRLAMMTRSMSLSVSALPWHLQRRIADVRWRYWPV